LANSLPPVILRTTGTKFIAEELQVIDMTEHSVTVVTKDGRLFSMLDDHVGWRPTGDFHGEVPFIET